MCAERTGTTVPTAASAGTQISSLVAIRKQRLAEADMGRPGTVRNHSVAVSRDTEGFPSETNGHRRSDLFHGQAYPDMRSPSWAQQPDSDEWRVPRAFQAYVRPLVRRAEGRIFMRSTGFRRRRRSICFDPGGISSRTRSHQTSRNRTLLGSTSPSGKSSSFSVRVASADSLPGSIAQTLPRRQV